MLTKSFPDKPQISKTHAGLMKVSRWSDEILPGRAVSGMRQKVPPQGWQFAGDSADCDPTHRQTDKDIIRHYRHRRFWKS